MLQQTVKETMQLSLCNLALYLVLLQIEKPKVKEQLVAIRIN